MAKCKKTTKVHITSEKDTDQERSRRPRIRNKPWLYVSQIHHIAQLQALNIRQEASICLFIANTNRGVASICNRATYGLSIPVYEQPVNGSAYNARAKYNPHQAAFALDTSKRIIRNGRIILEPKGHLYQRLQ